LIQTRLETERQEIRVTAKIGVPRENATRVISAVVIPANGDDGVVSS